MFLILLVSYDRYVKKIVLERSRERLLNYSKILHKRIFILKTKTHIKFEFTLSSTEVRNTTKHYLFKKTQL